MGAANQPGLSGLDEARSGNDGERARPQGRHPAPQSPDTCHTTYPMSLSVRSGGRTVAACECATDGNFSPLIAACGTFATDPPISPWGRDHDDQRDRPGGLIRSSGG